MVMITCLVCNAETPDFSKYCCNCGVLIEESQKKAQEEEDFRSGKKPLVRKIIPTPDGEKILEVYCHDITTFSDDIDVLTISAYSRRYFPSKRTVIASLAKKRRINVKHLAQKAWLDLRKGAACWMSGEIESEKRKTGENSSNTYGRISRIGCLEMRDYTIDDSGDKTEPLKEIATYFRMLDLASAAGASIETVAMPILGGGAQKIDRKMVVIPLVNEAVSFLKRNPKAKRFIFMEYSYENAGLIADTINKSYQLADLQSKMQVNGVAKEAFVFISYAAHGDSEIAELICHLLEEKGIRFWYAPREITSGSYGGQIVEAISKSTHFICIVSEYSMKSPHVLNEIDLAFQHLKDGIKILPFCLENKKNMIPEFKYYLSRMQTHLGYPTPVEQRAMEFVNEIFR